MLQSVLVLTSVRRAIGILVHAVAIPLTFLVIAVEAAAIGIFEVLMTMELTVLVITYLSSAVSEFHKARSVFFAVFQWTLVNSIRKDMLALFLRHFLKM